MKIAVLGSAPSLARAPFKNSAYDAWVGGKVQPEERNHDFVPGDFQIWGCSPGCWSVVPRAERWFEIHRWENDVSWFSPEYRQFLRDFKGPVYTGGRVPEILGHVVYPIDYIEEKFSSYFLTSSLALMMAMAIDEIEKIRAVRKKWKALTAQLRPQDLIAHQDGLQLPEYIPIEEREKDDSDDVIGMWGVDMAANEEYSYQRPGCQFFILECLRRGIGVYIPPESDLMRPMPVYGISEWDHNYIKLTEKARMMTKRIQDATAAQQQAHTDLIAVQAQMGTLNYFVATWTSPYGMQPGIVIRQDPETGLGSGITALDSRPISRLNVPPNPSLEAISTPARDPLMGQLEYLLGPQSQGEGMVETINRIIMERDAAENALAKRRKKKAPHRS